MSGTEQKYRLDLLGTFRLVSPEGERIDVASKRGQALIAMLAMAEGGERTRSWLQDRLWGSRQQLQAQASLRRELSTLRAAVNRDGRPLIDANFNRVAMDLEQVDVDAREPGMAGELLEGLDIQGEESFEDWLRETRMTVARRHERNAAGQMRLPQDVVDLAAPVPGFSGRPAIAVLPLENLTDDPQLDYLSDGIAEELIDRLSRLKWLPVIARTASFAYRGKPMTVPEIGAALGARYLLDGWIRQSDGRFRFSLTIADIETGYSVLNHSSDLPLQFTREDLFDLVMEIVGVLNMRVDAAERTRASRKVSSTLTTQDLIWRGRWHLLRFTTEDFVAAEKLLREALALEPNSPEALTQLTYLRANMIWMQRKSEDDMRELRQLAQSAILADPEDGRGYMFAGMAEMWARRASIGMPFFEKAVQLNPSLALAHGQIGSAYILSGDPVKAVDPIKLSLRLAPSDEHSFSMIGELAIANLMLENWDVAIEYAEQSLIRRKAYWYAHVIKINALVRQGEVGQAQMAVKELFLARAKLSRKMIDWLPFVDSKWNDYLADGLNMAGVISL